MDNLIKKIIEIKKRKNNKTNKRNIKNTNINANSLDVSLKEIQEEINDWNKKSKIIQSQFNFNIPDYLIDEIICYENEKDILNLYSIINCAVISGKITSDNGKKLKEVYC